jgi:two-component system sensor histidine kinase UhpB
MTGVLMQLARLDDAVGDDRRGELHDAQEAVRATVTEAARIAHELRPSLLDHLGLASALAELARTFTHRTGIRVDCHLDLGTSTLDAEVELAVYRIVQESLTNVARHAGARRVVLTLRHTPHRAHVEVVDDGHGLLPVTGGPPTETVWGSGLRGMRERALLIGGHLTIADAPAGGVRVSLDLPVEGPDR